MKRTTIAVGEAPVIGRMYRVPCIEYPTIYQGPTMWVPVYGPPHEDREIIGFPHQHYHVDIRFMSVRGLARYSGRINILEELLSYPMTVPVVIAPSLEAGTQPARVAVSPFPILKRRKCYREMPDFPGPVERRLQGFCRSFGPLLEDTYQGCQLKLDNPICPHRGFRLAGLPQKDGLVVCPGHGLRWDLRTGQMRRRCLPPEGKGGESR